MTPDTFAAFVLWTDEPAARAEFYAATLGWRATRVDDAGEVWVYNGSAAQPRLTLERPRAAGVAPQWIALVAVENLDATIARAVSLGARQVAGPWTHPRGIRRVAVLRDPQGQLFGLCDAK